MTLVPKSKFIQVQHSLVPIILIDHFPPPLFPLKFLHWPTFHLIRMTNTNHCLWFSIVFFAFSLPKSCIFRITFWRRCFLSSSHLLSPAHSPTFLPPYGPSTFLVRCGRSIRIWRGGRLVLLTSLPSPFPISSFILFLLPYWYDYLIRNRRRIAWMQPYKSVVLL